MPLAEIHPPTHTQIHTHKYMHGYTQSHTHVKYHSLMKLRSFKVRRQITNDRNSHLIFTGTSYPEGKGMSFEVL